MEGTAWDVVPRRPEDDWDALGKHLASEDAMKRLHCEMALRTGVQERDLIKLFGVVMVSETKRKLAADGTPPGPVSAMSPCIEMGPDAAAEWSPGANQGWHADVSRLVALVRSEPGLASADPALKFLTVHIDTRTGDFVIENRDGEAILPSRVAAAVAGAKARRA